MKHGWLVLGGVTVAAIAALTFASRQRPAPPIMHHPPPRRSPPRLPPAPFPRRKNTIYQTRGLAGQKSPGDNDPWNIGIATPIKGIPMGQDTWRGTGGHNRIAKEVANNARLYGPRIGC